MDRLESVATIPQSVENEVSERPVNFRRWKSARLNTPRGLVAKERPINEQFPRRLFVRQKNIGSPSLDEITVCIHHPYRAIRVITFIPVSDDYCFEKRTQERKKKKKKIRQKTTKKKKGEMRKKKAVEG